MVVLFAVLLTRRSRADLTVTLDSLARTVAALLAGGAVLGVLFGAVLSTRVIAIASPAPTVTVRDVGAQLMGPHAAAVLVVGLILTVALLGAIVLAAVDRPEKREDAG